MFLSCLYGSEQSVKWGLRKLEFLSCLYGSEHIEDFLIALEEFLSCLYGSEQQELLFQPAQYISKLPVRQ